MAPYKLAVRHRGFRLLLFGQGMSMAGDAVCLATLPLAFIHTGLSGKTFSFVMAAVGLGTFVGAGLGGALADRVSPRNVVFCTDLTRGLIQFLVTFLFITAPEDALIVASYLLFGIGIGVSRPCTQVLLTELLPEGSLIAGNGLMNFIDNLVAVALPGSVGVIIIWWDPIAGVFIDGVTFIAAALVTLFIPDVGKYVGDDSFRLRDTVAGFRTVAHDRCLTLGMSCTVFLNVLCFPVFLVIAPFSVAHRFSESLWGTCLAASGAGACVGSIAIVYFKAHHFLGRMSLLCGCALTGGLLMIALGTTAAEVLSGSVFVGFVEAAWLTVWSTAMQIFSPPAELGRVVAVDTVLTGGAQPLVYLGSGFLGASVGYSDALIGSAAICAGGVLLANMLNAIRNRPDKCPQSQEF